MDVLCMFSPGVEAVVNKCMARGPPAGELVLFRRGRRSEGARGVKRCFRRLLGGGCDGTTLIHIYTYLYLTVIHKYE